MDVTPQTCKCQYKYCQMRMHCQHFKINVLYVCEIYHAHVWTYIHSHLKFADYALAFHNTFACDDADSAFAFDNALAWDFDQGCPCICDKWTLHFSFDNFVSFGIL